MPRATFRFYAELNDFLPPERRGRAFAAEFRGHETVKDLIESLGVPHPEVDGILVNGEFAGFSRPVRDGDSISVYPLFRSLDPGAAARLRPEPLRRPAFLLDTHLGRLAAYLRLLGFDSACGSALPDAELAERSAAEGRILLTRDRGLLKRSIVTRGCCVRSDSPRAQLREVVDRFDLAGAARPFRRCLACNGLLAPADKAQIEDRIPPGTSARFDAFFRCAGCGRIYWPGSHFARLQALVREALTRPAGDNPGPRPVCPDSPEH
jgi:uncharacterized protein with PIN domain